MKNSIERLERMKNRPKPRMYMLYMVMIICVIYITDELASSICTQMKTEIANDLFSVFGNKSVAKLDLLAMISYPCMALSLFYRTLSDRFGRKIFLVINTLGMGLGMFIVFISTNIAMYIFGYCVISFFVPHDMQVVYIMETAPAKHRAKIYSVVKSISTLGVILIPVFRSALMRDVGEWRKVFLIPAVLGLAASVAGLLFARESDAFIDSRLKYLRLTEEEKAAAAADKSKSNAQGGFFAAFRYSMHNKQLRRLNILMAFFNLGFIITMNYQVMLSYGYAANVAGENITESVLAQVGTSQVTKALLLFPVGSAFIQLIEGFISDRAGRKPASVIMAAVTAGSFIGFTVGAGCGISPYIAGLLAGVCIGSFWAFGDINVMMMSESAPTNLRASVLSSCYVLGIIGTFTGMGIFIPVMNALGNEAAAVTAGCIAIPGFIAAVILLMGTKETKGTELK